MTTPGSEAPPRSDLRIRPIIFSKDRPMQLQALLESFFHHVVPEPHCTVVFRHRDEYLEIVNRYREITWIAESRFGAGLADGIAAGTEELVMFLVDDQIVVGEMDLAEAAKVMENPEVLCYSFRLGHNIYAEPETLERCGTKSLRYQWRGEHKDWGYPFSMDAHVYRRRDIQPLLSDFDRYRAPADFEAAGFPRFLATGAPYMAFADGDSTCYSQDVNKVQLYHGAPQFGQEGVHDVDSLLEQYRQGFRIDWESAEGFIHDDPFIRTACWRLRAVE